MEQTSLRPLFELSARQGIIYGIIFTVMSGCLLFGLQMPTLTLLMMILAAGVIIYMPFSTAFVVSHDTAYCTLPAIWMSGIIQYVCGALICSLINAIFLTLISPDFLSNYLAQMIALLKEMDNKEVSESAFVISPMQFIGAMFWTTALYGSITSLLMGIILPRSSFFRRLLTRCQSQIFNS